MLASMDEARTLLMGAKAKGIDPSLEPVDALLDELGRPDEDFESIQIVGTNGKTSTARYLAAILNGHGLRTGLFVSPCLVDYTDQIEADGRCVDEDSFAQAVLDVVAAGARVNEARAKRCEGELPFTEFDLLTVATLLLFSRLGVQAAVLEAGMGGAWDATSAARSVCVVGATGVGLDHTRILGSTIEQISEQKAAVIGRGRRCVLGPGIMADESAKRVFFTRCAEQGVRPVCVAPDEGMSALCEADAAVYRVLERQTRLDEPLRLSVHTQLGDYDGLRALKPCYQAPNIACAVVLAEQFLGRRLDEGALFEAVMGCPTPGRFEVVRAKPLVLLDACHNPQSVRAFLGALDDIEPQVSQRPTLLCAIFADKDVEKMVGMLARAFPRVVVTRTESERAMEPQALGAMFAAHGLEPAQVCDSVNEALDALFGEPMVACGSITTAGEVFALAKAPDGRGNYVRA